MATNGNNLEQNFDALLQAHVKTQESIKLTVCEQFDPETANAYLERALTKNALIAYEAHLADCVSCRRHVIAIARLMPAPVTISEAGAGAAHVPLKVRLIEWFAGWHLGALAGLGAVAATILVIAVIVNRPRPTEQMIVASKAKDESVVLWQATPAPSTAPTSDTAATDKLAQGAPSATPAVNVRGSGALSIPAQTLGEAVPTAPAAPPPPMPTLAPTAKTAEERKEIAAQQAGQVDNIARAQNRGQYYRDLPSSGPAANQVQTERGLPLEQQKREAPAASSAAPAPATKPPEKTIERTVEKEKKSDSKPLADARRDELAAGKSADTEVRQRSAKPKSMPKPSPAEGKTERPAQSVRNIGNKSFRLENGVWIDTQYEAGKRLPLIRLSPDSDAYQQTVQESPGLKPYFGLKPVIVVWQGKVYRVE